MVLTAKGGAWYTCAGAGSKLFQLKMYEEDIVKAVKDAGIYGVGLTVLRGLKRTPVNLRGLKRTTVKPLIEDTPKEDN